MKRILASILLCSCFFKGFSQNDTFKVANGAWNVAANWTSGVPTNAQDVVIAAGCLASVPGSGPVCKSLTINGTLSFGGPSGPYQVTVTNNVSVSATGSITMGGSSNCFIYYSGSSFTVAAGATLTMNTSSAYAGIVYSGTGASTLISNSASNFGSINISSSGTLSTGSNLILNNQITVGTTGTFKVAAGNTVTLLAASGIVVNNGGKINIDGTLINQSTTDMNLNTVAYSIYLNAGATYVHQTTAAIGTGSTTPIFARLKIDPASTFIFRGGGGIDAQQAMDGKTYGNLSFESVSGSYAPNPNGGSGNPLIVQGNLTLGGGTGTGTVFMDLTNNPYLDVINVSGNTIIYRGSELRTYNISGSQLNTAGNVTISGKLTMNSNVTVGGNWNLDTSGSVVLGSASADSVVFNGTGNQTITKINGGSVVTFPYLVQNKASGSIILSSSPATDVTISTTAGNVLALNNAGQLDLNGRTFTLSGSGGNISASGAARNIISSVAGGTFAITGSKTVVNASSGSLIFGNNVTVLLTAAFNPGSNLTTIGSGAALQLNSGGSVATNMPLYASGSSLIYNTGGVLTRSIEWGASGVGTIGTTAGYPHNVTVQNNTTLNIGITTIDNRAMNGDLTIASGSTLSMNTMDQTNRNLTVNGNVILNGTLNLASGTNTDSTQGQILVGGNWTRSSSGVFNPNVTSNPPASTDKARAVTFIGSSNSIISAPYSATRNINGSYGGETFPYLYINKTNTANNVSLAANITITREIGFQKGTFTLNDSNVCIISNANSTAHVAVMTATQLSSTSINYNGNGRFIIQRYFPIQNTSAGRRWRLLTAPVQSSGAPTINAAWQEGVSNTAVNSLQNPSPGFGTEITDNTIAYTGNGYDAGTQPNASLYYLDPVSGFNFPAATNTGAITDHDGYFLFIRGDRGVTIGNQYVAATSTTLEPKGKINIGNVSKVISAAGQLLIGNPYASAIKMDGVKVNGTAFSTSGTYHVWDPKTSGSSNVGKFITVLSLGGGSYAVDPNTSNIQGGIIESSGAFVLANKPANTTVDFTEANKITSSRTTGIASRPENNITADLTTSVYALLSGTPSLASGTVNLFNNIYSNEIDVRDAPRISYFNSKEVLSIKRGNNLLAIETRAAINNADTIFFNMTNFSATIQTYRLQFAASDFGNTVQAFLKDKYTGTSTQINLNDTTDYDFNITTDSLSQATDRFMIVFADGGPLALHFENVKAWQNDVNEVNVAWQLSNTSNIKSFLIERGSDGIHFSSVATLNNNVFNAIDKEPLKGNNYYRIACVQANGHIEYSEIIKINIGSIVSGLSIYPNPVKDILSLQMSNMPAGKYDLIISNSAGQQILKTQLLGRGGVSTEMISLPATMTKGVYDLQLRDGAGNKKMISVIKD